MAAENTETNNVQIVLQEPVNKSRAIIKFGPASDGSASDLIIDLRTLSTGGIVGGGTGPSGEVGGGVDLSQYYTKSEIDSTVVKLSGDQTIAGVKTFTGIPNLTSDVGNLNLVSKSAGAPVYLTLLRQSTKVAYVGFLSSNNNTLCFNNLISGGTVSFNVVAGYMSDVAITDDKHLAHKKYVDTQIAALETRIAALEEKE